MTYQWPSNCMYAAYCIMLCNFILRPVGDLKYNHVTGRNQSCLLLFAEANFNFILCKITTKVGGHKVYFSSSY